MKAFLFYLMWLLVCAGIAWTFGWDVFDVVAVMALSMASDLYFETWRR